MNKYCVIDVETTGGRAGEDAIIQIAAVLLENLNIVNEFSTYVYTDQKIPHFITELTGISTADIKNAPQIGAVLVQILPMLADAYFVAHNATFDQQFIDSALMGAGYTEISNSIIDTLLCSRIAYPTMQSYKLESIAKALNINHLNPHNALDDVLATAELLVMLIEKFNGKPILYLQQLVKLISGINQGLTQILNFILNEKYINNPSDSTFEEYVFNYFVLKKANISAVAFHHNNEGPYDFDSVFTQDGYLVNSFPNYEYREGQEEMAQEIRRAFYDNRYLMIEAGTGTGKTLAYLLPAIFWAKEEGEQIVISTHTINLQEQLFKKDIPFLKESLPFNFSAAILKGRNNYICLRRFAIKYQDKIREFDTNVNTFFDLDRSVAVEETIEVARILTWISETESGDYEELNLSISGKYLWNEIKSESESCLNRKCPWFNDCFYHRAKQRAQKADIVITNHSLLLTSLKTDQSILPKYNCLIIDEAHQLEPVAIKHLGYEISFIHILNNINKLFRDGNNGSLARVIKEFQYFKNNDDADLLPNIKQLTSDLFPQLLKEADRYYTLLEDYIGANNISAENGRQVIRINEKNHQLDSWDIIRVASENVSLLLHESIVQLTAIHTKIVDVFDEESIQLDYESSLIALRNIAVNFEDWNKFSSDNTVYWVESSYRGKKLTSTIFAAPIEIGKYLQESLISNLESVIMTSATLAVGESFEFISNDYGFKTNNDSLTTIITPSPFDYNKQVRVYVPDDVPAIKGVAEDIFVEYISKSIAEIAILLEGRTLVLFTSHSMLQKAHRTLVELLKDEGIKILGHNIDSSSRSKLTESFLDNNRTILLGTNSFWEGVDIPGESLSALCIVRLPFTPPKEPVQEAKEEKLKAEGRNSFLELSLPQAIIRFKQGFGRLIRTHQDRGVVVIFDNRITNSWYGKAFIRALPEVEVQHRSFKAILRDIESWFY